MEQLNEKQLEKTSGGTNENTSISSYDYCHFNPSKWQLKQVFGPGTSCSPNAQNRCMSCKHFSKDGPNTDNGTCSQM